MLRSKIVDRGREYEEKIKRSMHPGGYENKASHCLNHLIVAIKPVALEKRHRQNRPGKSAPIETRREGALAGMKQQA